MEDLLVTSSVEELIVTLPVYCGVWGCIVGHYLEKPSGYQGEWSTGGGPKAKT